MRDPEFKRLPSWAWAVPLGLVFLSIFGAIADHIDRQKAISRALSQAEQQDEEKKVPVVSDGMTITLSQEWTKLRSVPKDQNHSKIYLIPSDTILYTNDDGLEYEVTKGNIWYRNGSAVTTYPRSLKYFYVRVKPPAQTATLTFRVTD